LRTRSLSVRFRTVGLQTPTPKQDEADAEPLQAFFPDRHYVSLLEVLATVNRYSGFLDDFQHWQQRYHRERPPPRTFLAGIVGLGCGIGIRKMAQISNQINETELDHTVNWFFSTEGAHAANDRVVRLMDQLELPNLYRRIPGNCIPPVTDRSSKSGSIHSTPTTRSSISGNTRA